MTRISQRDIKPLAVKFRFSEFYDPKENTINFKDDLGNSAFKIELDNGTITFGTNVKFDAAITKGVSPFSFVPEIQMFLLGGGSSGGGTGSYYTDQATYQNLNASKFQINPDEYPGCSFYLECNMRAGAVGDPDRTIYADLYDVAAAATVTGSEISTSQKDSSPGAGGIPRIRGTTNFRGNMTSGPRDYIVRYKTSSAGSFVDIFSARLIIDFT